MSEKTELRGRLEGDLLNLADDVEGLQFVRRDAMQDVIRECLERIYRIDEALGGNLREVREHATRVAKKVLEAKRGQDGTDADHG